MSDLFTKAANVKTTTKLWIVGIAFLIMVNIPYIDHHDQPSHAATLAPRPSGITALSTPTGVVPEARSLNWTGKSVQSGAPPKPLTSVAGGYIGTVHNATAAVSASFAITLQESNGTLSGSMIVKPPLYGSGALLGSTSGSDVAFTVTSSTGKIVFRGSRIKHSITGAYTVTQPSGGIEKGTFSMDRASRPRRATTSPASEEPTAAPPTLHNLRPFEPAAAPIAPISASPVEAYRIPRYPFFLDLFVGLPIFRSTHPISAFAIRTTTSELTRKAFAVIGR